MCSDDKKLKIRETIKANKVRRKGFSVKVFSCKVDVSHCSVKKLKLLNGLFLQAKWLYNEILGSVDLFKFDTKIKTVNVHFKDKIEVRDLTIGSQIKQSIFERTKQNIINLGKAKKVGIKTGRLKFKSEVNSIPLKQYGVTYRLVGNSYVKIQGIGKLKCAGLNQLKGEITSAVLVKTSQGYFLKATCYTEKETEMRAGVIGIDFGIKDTVVDSNGVKQNFRFPVPEKLKCKQRDLSRKVKGSNNYRKQCNRISRNYEQLTNQKNDAANKYVASLKKYEKVIIQDENIRGWHANLFGKQVQQSILGRIKSKIQNLETSVTINRWLPTTKMSPVSFKKINIGLNDRIFKDGNFEEDRDTKSAKTILCFGLYKPSLTHKELMGLPAEERVSIFSNYKFEVSKLFPMKQEAFAL